MTAKPNFFIVGAPKAGTTAMYEYLRTHPNVFMPRLKEPHFFATDLGAYPPIKTQAAYGALFGESTADHTHLGEASVHYLRSTRAIGNIRAFDPHARIVAMLRNPVDLVHALHGQLLYVAEETVGDFETAWRLQERRRTGLDLPPNCRTPRLLDYADVGSLGTQVMRLLATFPPDQVKLLLFEDFTASPAAAYAEVVDFLRLPRDERTEFPRINDSKHAKSATLKRFLRKPPPVLRSLVRGLKGALGAEGLVALKTGVVRLNTVKASRAPLAPAFRAELVDAFGKEIALLGQILGRDLSHWTRPPCAPPPLTRRRHRRYHSRRRRRCRPCKALARPPPHFRPGRSTVIIVRRERGGTGRRAGLRILSRKGSGFDSRRSHQLES